MRTRTLLISVLTLLGMVPAATASHLSVGWNDAAAMEAEESPTDPTVPQKDYDIGTSRDCYEPNSSNRSVEELGRARTSDAFCGDLIYHENTPYEQVADPDQKLNGPVGQFDVIRSAEPNGYSRLCIPWCSGDVAQQTVFTTFHDAGAQLDLTHDAEEADQKEGDREQTYGFTPAVPAASHIVGNNAETWRMNGWAHPQPLSETFVGFLYDHDGAPIDDERLKDIVSRNRDKFAQHRSIEDSVCGFSRESFALSVGLFGILYLPPGWCQIQFEWVGESASGANFRDGYDDPCKSPTYVCGSLQPAWKSSVTCLDAVGCPDGLSAPDADYISWHWIVAPTRSACNGQQIPGASFDTDAEWDYLAHDLDVWVPMTSMDEVQNSEGVANVRDWAVQPEQLYRDTLDTTDEHVSEAYADVDERVENLTDGIGVPDLPTGVPDTAKSSRVEPNHDPDDLALMGLTEDSQTKHWNRNENHDSCSVFFGDAEEHVDPWVNIVDLDSVFTGTGGQVGGLGFALYGNNDADHQDDVNQPTGGPVYFEGKIGIFTDKNDYGHYDHVIDGASHPLFWDMHVDETGVIDTETGCEFGDGKRLVEAMQNAYYGPHTGLLLAVYLEEPTAIYDPSNSQTVPFPAGQNIFVHESQALTQLRHQGDPHVTGFIDHVTQGLRNHPAIADEADTVYVNDHLDRASSFASQCDSSYPWEFGTEVSLLHQCETGCKGDTIVTGYMVESTHPDHQIGANQGRIPILEFDNGDVFELDQRIETWLDVDPFDNNPDRNRENSSAPPD